MHPLMQVSPSFKGGKLICFLSIAKCHQTELYIVHTWAVAWACSPAGLLQE